MVFVIACFAMLVPAIEMDDYVHLILFYPYYPSVIYRDQKARDVSFDWGHTGEGSAFDFGTVNQRTLIYDRSGHAARRVGKVETYELGRSYTEHLFGRFFINNDVTILH